MKAPSTADLKTMASSESKTSFPLTLHKMLTEIDDLAARNCDTKNLQSIISWQEHGMAFKIHDRKNFSKVVMPLWFPRLKYSSWVRQLNSYGFKRVINEGNDKSCVYHEKFLRDMPEMAATIDRVPRKKKSTTESDPAFDNLSSAPVPAPAFTFPAVNKSNNTSPRKSLSAPPSPTNNGLHALLLRTKTSNTLSLPSTPWFPQVEQQQEEPEQQQHQEDLLGMNIFVDESLQNEYNSDDDESAADQSMINAFQQVWKSFDSESAAPAEPQNPWEPLPLREEADMEPLRIFAPGTDGLSGSQNFQYYHQSS